MKHQLRDKVEKAVALLRKVQPIALKYREFGMIGAFSGGKDSQVIRGLLNIAEVPHIMKYQWTTIDPPEVYHFVRDECPDVIIERPEETFWHLCLRHGILPTQYQRFCCRELKESRDTHCVTITGVRRAESYRRARRNEVEIQTRRRHPDYVSGTYDEFNMYRDTHTDCIMGKDKLLVNPIIEWSTQDVWDFIRYMDLPYCSLYDNGYSRVGCLFCPMANRKSLYKMVQDYPKYVQAFIRLIHRIREKRLAKGGYDVYQTLTDEQVFFGWLDKKGVARMLADSCQRCIEF